MSDASPGDRSEAEARRGAARTDGVSVSDANGGSSELRSDGGERLQAHTVRLELVDEPGELLRALEPIAEHGGNLLSIFHERGSLTPRGHIPVEIDIECAAGGLDEIVAALRDAGVKVIQTDAERYTEHATVVLVGDLIGTDLSDTLARVEDAEAASLIDVSLSAPDGDETIASARLHLAAASGSVGDALSRVRDVADEKDLRVIEPLVDDGGSR